jgi:hypothetical protein
LRAPNSSKPYAANSKPYAAQNAAQMISDSKINLFAERAKLSLNGMQNIKNKG